ncbi:MAG TPA: thioredoxin [Chloroflexota bacterium]|jgi:thioredoxin 1|nr:thioredoxin [Chloroflexota bacterium]
MPVVVDYSKCDHHNCFPLEVCPHTGEALLDDGQRIVAQPEVCGDCPAPCLNFCDKKALRYAPNMEEIELVLAELEGTMTKEQVEAARAEKKAAAKAAEEAAKAGAVMPVSTDQFESQVLNSDIPVAVDFWAEWCGPCKQMAPIFEELAKSYAGVMKFCKVDTDKEQAIAMRYRIQAIPTLIFFWDGQEVDRIQGALPPQTLQTVIYQLLAAIQQHKAAQQQQQSAAKSPLL